MTPDELKKIVADAKRSKTLEGTVQSTIELLRKIGTENVEAVNTMATMILKEHRTHQQSIIRSLFLILKIYAISSESFDARNEAAVEWAKKVTDDYTVFPYI